MSPAQENPPRQDLNARLRLAVDSHRRGEVERARSLYRAILEDHPRSFDALHLLGVLSADSGALVEGVELIRRALAVNAANAAPHYSLASALFKQGDGNAALGALGRALTIDPHHVDAWFLRANILQASGALAPAVEAYRETIRLNPAFAEAYNNLAAAQRGLRQLEEALGHVNRALLLRPEYPRALNNRGLLALDCKHGMAAIEDFRRALELTPDFPEALHNLATALMQLRRFSEARDAFARLALLAPQFPHAAGNRLYAQLNCCDWAQFEPQVAAVTRAVARGEHAAVPLTLLCICDSAPLQLQCARTYTQGYYPERASPRSEAVRTPTPSGGALRVQSPRDEQLREPLSRTSRDRLRVAYLSGDLGEHAVSYLLAGVFERHDAASFETIALSWERRGEGAIRRRLEAAFSSFIDISSRSDAEVARLMRDLDVNIAVDLGGHTLGQRTDILARRAAPIQVNYLGLPATMGAPYMDYLMADRFLIPERRFGDYAERVVWLPEGFQPNDDRRRAAQALPRSAFGLPDGAFVFCCFNRNCKMTPACFEVWMRLIGSVPGSVLWLLAGSESVADNLRREAAVRGVDSSRLVFAGDVPYAEYLARYRHADLFLDTLPFNGGTTVSDALTMGRPVLTCAGESFAARMAGSLLEHLGLAELVVSSLEEYEATALRLARDPGHLRTLRERLEQCRSAHAFFDTDRYRRHLECAYRTMWERHVAGLPAAAFAVPALPRDQATGRDPGSGANADRRIRGEGASEAL